MQTKSRERKRKKRIRIRKKSGDAGERKLNKRELRPKREDLGDMSGGDDGFAMTLEEIAQEFGVTRERARQYVYDALGRIRREHPELKELIE